VLETTEEIGALQAAIDRTWASAGDHLLEVWPERCRMDAEELTARMTGMRVLVLATASSDGRPFTGPVDAFLVGGSWHLGTAPGALRARHLAARPACSATYVEGEEVVVTVHGRAVPIDPLATERYARVCRERYGPDWDGWHVGNPYWRIEADRVLACDGTRR
jgi:hypothetical protein